MKKILSEIGIFVAAIILALLIGEAMIRVINTTGKNYDIEMWKYGKYLKKKSDNPDMGIEHVPSKSMKLQNTFVKINSLGFRDREYTIPKPANVYRVLVLGSSITFGWGVDEDKTYVRQIEKQLEGKTGDHKIELINAAVGNYNTVREVASFFEKCLVLEPDMVILSFFINDPEILTVQKIIFS